ncbi:GGDEF domain-containing protein [Kineococcus arenarius]|uniref:GGDEF domain-containing protein n=1 Tax=Kineococcus sp. SYSU DK007 TaxID=3383128 RepID=UPI003D7C93AF
MTSDAQHRPAPPARSSWPSWPSWLSQRADGRASGAAWARSAAFAAVFTVAVFLGRLTVMDGTSLSLVWPAAGVATLWFAVQRGAGTRYVDYAALGSITFTVNALTGASALLSLCFVAANVVQVAVFHALLHRWEPSLWGAGGTQPLTGTRQLARMLLAALAATGAGALFGPTAVGVLTGHWSALTTAVWMTRNTVSVVLIMGLGLRVGYLIAARERARAAERAGSREPVALPFQHLHGARRVELAVLLAASVAGYLLVFHVLETLPIAFPLIALTVWAALRFDTAIVVVHDFAVGVAAVLFTLSGHGPFAFVASDSTRALVVQAFVGLVAVIGVTLALGRDEREVLLHRVRRQAAEADERTAHVEVLAAVARQLYTSDDVRADICAAARQVSGADMAYLLEPDGCGNLVTTAAAASPDGPQVPPVTFSLDGEPSLTVRAFRGHELVFVGDVAEHAGTSQRVVQGLRIAAAAWQPVHTGAEQAIGVLALAWHRPVAALQQHLPAMLQTLASEAGAAIERGDLLVRLAGAVGRDALTGLANRMRWDETATAEIARAARHGLPLTFALIDLDHFKRYNDTCGHLAGDALLRDFAAAAAGHLRDVDTLARWGGEEFAMALPGCTATDAVAVADRVRASVPHAQTCTIGIAQWQPGQDVDDVLAAADRALYRGKSTGRDVSVIATDLTEPADTGGRG